jgi:two-component system, cell cycle sensor histidine kinase and response regulator CckA
MATILIVDDQPINRDVLRSILSDRGHRVLEAQDGLEALATISDEMPDLLITDVIMPRMDGFQLVRELRAQPETAALPIIFTTAHYQEPEVIPLARAYGIRHVLTKWDSQENLCAAIEAELRAGHHSSTTWSGS